FDISAPGSVWKPHEALRQNGRRKRGPRGPRGWRGRGRVVRFPVSNPRLIRSNRMRMQGHTVLLSLALVVSGCAAGPQEPADLVLLNGHVVTVDSTQPEAEAIAVRGHLIQAVGSTEDI